MKHALIVCSFCPNKYEPATVEATH